MRIRLTPALVAVVVACAIMGTTASAAPCCDNQVPESYFEQK